MNTKTKPDRPDHRIPGKSYCLTEAEKAIRLRMSTSFLQKDRLRAEPRVDFARIGNSVRYSED